MSARSLPDPATVDECIAVMTDVIVQQFHPEQIILFGSQARRNADARSDVDLLVVMPDDVDRRRTAIAITRAVSDIPVAKDIVVTTPAEIAQRGHVVGSVLRPALRELHPAINRRATIAKPARSRLGPRWRRVPGVPSRVDAAS